MALQDILEHPEKYGFEKLSLKEAGKGLAGYIEKCNEEFLEYDDISINLGLKLLLHSQEYREAIRKYADDAKKIVDKYGPSNTWAVLRLSPKAIWDIKDICDKFMDEMSKYAIGQVLLANDNVIERCQKEIKEAGFSFFDNWKDAGGTYKRMLKAAEKHGYPFELIVFGDYSYKFLNCFSGPYPKLNS